MNERKGYAQPVFWVLQMVLFVLLLLAGLLLLNNMRSPAPQPTMTATAVIALTLVTPFPTATTAVTHPPVNHEQLPTPTLNPAVITPPATATALPTIPATLTPTPPAPDVESKVESILSQMTLDQKIGQMLMIGLPGTAVDDSTWNRIVGQNIGGIILLGRNTASPEQVLSLTTNLQHTAVNEGFGLSLFIAWNHEGGRVSRHPAGMTWFPNTMAVGAINEPETAAAVAQAMGKEMLSLGVNMNYAPVLDVNSDPANPVIGLRAYSSQPEQVSQLGSAYIRTLQETGVIAVAKHFPGHGGVPVDSHLALPRLEATSDSIRQIELPPFATAVTNNIAAIMVAHLQVPALDPSDQPASLSTLIVNDLLRGEMGYDGLVMTDDMGMGAIINNYDLGQAAVLAVQAGNDMLLTVEYQRYPDIMRQAILDAVNNGIISEGRINESVRRILRLKLAHDLSAPPPTPVLPDQQAHQQLAYDVGMGAVQIRQDTAGWLPLDLPTGQLLLISPNKINPGSQLYDNQSLLGEVLAAEGLTITELFYDHESPADITAVQTQGIGVATAVDAIIIITWDANLRYAQWEETAQENLVNALLATGKPVIVVFGQLPYDHLRFPDAPTQIAAYGHTTGQITGIAAKLGFGSGE